MAIIHQSTAISAKVHAKFGHRLNKNDYQNLIECKNISDVVLYLKNNTHYSSVFTKINEYCVHRGKVEQLLKQKLFYDFDSLCRYDPKSGVNFSHHIVRRYEIDQLIHFLTLLNSDNTERYIFILPSYFKKHTNIDLQGLARARTYEDVLNATSNSPYKKILSKFAPNKDNKVNIQAIENAMYNFMYDELYNTIQKNKSKREREDLKKLFDTLNDFKNIEKIYRVKKFYNVDLTALKNFLLPFGTINQNKLVKICQAETDEDMLNELRTTSIGKLIDRGSVNSLSSIFLKARFNLLYHNMFLAESPTVVMFSYIFITDIELSNIINIIEGVRYGLTANEIEQIIICK